MEAARRAVIDVGTNSVKLLVAEVEGHVVRPLWESGTQTRLGEGFYETHRLQPRAIERTAQAVAEFAGRARSFQVESPRLIATSAARDAVNQGELVEALEKQSGLKVEVISGDEEAKMAYLGVRTDSAFTGRRLLIMDAGGGSTEFTLGEGDQRTFQQSFPLGAVRLLEKFKPSDPPTPVQLEHCRDWLRDFIDHKIHRALEAVLATGRAETRLVGTGGTAAILARLELGLDAYDRERIEAVRLSADTVSRWVDRLWSVPLAERRRIAGLPVERADVILTGAAIYEAVLRRFGFAGMRVSTRGLRFAALLPSGPDRNGVH